MLPFVTGPKSPGSRITTAKGESSSAAQDVLRDLEATSLEPFLTMPRSTRLAAWGGFTTSSVSACR